ncbi:secretory lipase [Fusarium albosuccineum]|uniref:Secretory lipase n=1 Tax=Fusarium albosuccineum TaxID=1237068 RepID=A0A8H4L048_9HYPO|nr:secretory lipase [Fusarium albosuccineum]
MHLPILSLVALVATPLAAANTPSKFCDAACLKEFEEARSSEASGWVSQNVTLDPFYKAPEGLSSKAPGTLLRWQNVPDAQLSTNWTIPAGLSLSRFLYVSEDHDGITVPASAYALLPYSQVTIAGDTNTTVYLLIPIKCMASTVQKNTVFFHINSIITHEYNEAS